LATNNVSAAAPERSATDSGEIPEVVVTATRRAENLQNVPIAITALTAETLAELNVQTFDDMVKYLPNVSTASKGPGINEIYMRGLSTTQGGAQGGGGINSFPNVAVYLDDQSAQLPSRNLDVYAADIERIEVLEGPQGTLYGAGAQAGAIRYITNKPKIDKTEAGVSASYSTTAHGDPSASAESFINLPLVPNTLAVRAVIYNDSRGGYIHNIPGTFARSPTDIGIVNYFGGAVPAGSPTISNSAVVNKAYNPTVYQGLRLSGLYKINDEWDLLIQQSYQSLQADGSFAYAPSLGDLNVQEYNPSTNKDKFEDTAWTLNGRIAALKLVYTGGYLTRNITEVQDYTAYSRSVFPAYYQCNGPGVFGTGSTNVCFSPSAIWNDFEKNTHQTHELRLSTPDEWRARAIAGLFWEDYKIQETANWFFGSGSAGFNGQKPLPGTTQFDPSIRSPGDVFFDDITRGYKQKAAFGEFSFDIVPKQLTFSLGTRLYSIDTFELGSANFGYGCRNVPEGRCRVGVNLDTANLDKTFSGHKNKLNISWKIADDVLVYATYSEGFRPGGFNRGQDIVPTSSPLYGKFTIPLYYSPDTLKNKEIGWKTSWLNHHLQFDGAVYQEDWLNVQLAIFDPGLYGNQIFTANGPDYRVRGIEGNVIFKPTDHLTVSSSFSWNSSSQQNAPSLVGNNGIPVSIFPTAGVGSTLAQSPPFQGNVRARYEFSIRDYESYWQLGAQHTAHSYASVITVGTFEAPRQNQDAYTNYDASLGAKKDAWSAELFGDNLTDTRAQLYVNNGFTPVHLVTPNRPRTVGLRIGYKF
jgi:outer membrane receptor protein involved in Fe transport